MDDVDKSLKQVDWDFQYGSQEVEEMLETGITSENLSLDFLRSVLVLIKEDENLYKCSRFGLYLQFENNILKHFTSADLENSSTKWLKKINPKMVRDLLDEAMMYHSTEFSAMEEVNRQADALRNTPHAVDNPYLHLHRTPTGNVSFFNILVTHHQHPCSLEDFLFMNKGRYQNMGNNTYKAGRFIYVFNEEGQLESNTKL